VAKRTRAVEAERAAWRVRRPWPIALLGVDPGTEVAGAGLVLPDATGEEPDLRWVRSIDPYSLEIESAIDDACDAARARGVGLAFVLEEWGQGGPMGIESWLGLGAARGHWKRAAMLAALGRHSDVLVPSRLFTYAHIQTWRSWMDVPPGTWDAAGKFAHHDPEGWKKAATTRLAALYPKVRIDSADAAEAGLIALYGCRSDDVGRKLPKRLLAGAGIDEPPPRVKKAKKPAKPKTVEVLPPAA